MSEYTHGWGGELANGLSGPVTAHPASPHIPQSVRADKRSADVAASNRVYFLTGPGALPTLQQCKFFDSGSHRGAFCLPQWVYRAQDAGQGKDGPGSARPAGVARIVGTFPHLQWVYGMQDVVRRMRV